MEEHSNFISGGAREALLCRDGERAATLWSIRRYADLGSYFLVIACGYYLLKGFAYIRPIGDVRLPETGITLADIYAGLVIVAAYCGRRFRVSAAEWLAAMIEYLHYATVPAVRAMPREHWPELLGGADVARARFGVEGRHWKYVAIFTAATFGVVVQLAGPAWQACAVAAAFAVAVAFFNLIRVRGQRRAAEGGGRTEA